MYIVLFWIFFPTNVGGIGAYFVYSQWYLKKDTSHINFNTRTQTTVY